MASPLIGTVVITGGNGALGSEIAVAIAKKHPLVHLLLVAREPQAESVRQVSNRIRHIGPRSLEIAKVDFTDFISVSKFANYTVQRVKRKDIPPIITLINSAATISYVRDTITGDGYDPVYQTNCLSPFLLTVSLLEGFRAGGRGSQRRALVLNVSCSSISHGRLDYFSGPRKEGSDQEKALLSVKEGTVRFGSSKLLMSAAMYALRRSLLLAGNIPLDIYTLDPGGMIGESHLSANMPRSVRFSHKTRASLHPLMRIFSKAAMNPTSVPAKIIAKLAFENRIADDSRLDRYYILGDAYEASFINPVLRDGLKMEELLRTVMKQVGMGPDEFQSPH